MIINKMTIDKCLDKMAFNKMTMYYVNLDKMTVVQMSVDEMSWRLWQHRVPSYVRR
jgi:hypothetical protein